MPTREWQLCRSVCCGGCQEAILGSSVLNERYWPHFLVVIFLPSTPVCSLHMQESLRDLDQGHCQYGTAQVTKKSHSNKIPGPNVNTCKQRYILHLVPFMPPLTQICLGLLVVCGGGLWKAVWWVLLSVQCMLMCMGSKLCCEWLQCTMYILVLRSVLHACRKLECMGSAGSVWYVGV